MSMARCRVEPGVHTQLHTLNGVQEVYYIESGHGIMDDGARDGFEVKAGDNIVIKAGHPQRILNNGQSDLIFSGDLYTAVCA